MLKQAVFLVGGMGSRLKELTRVTPKPLISVAGRPFIDYLIDEAVRHGFTDVVLLAGYLGDQFLQHYNGRRVREAVVRVITEPQPMGTAGALRFAIDELDDMFLLSNGDSFFDINLRAIQFPQKNTMSMALRAESPGKRYGTIELDNGFVSNFYSPDKGVQGPINAGVYVLSKEIVKSFPDGPSSLESDHFPILAQQRRIQGQVFDRFFIDMGVPEDLNRAQIEMPLRTKRPAVFFDRDGVLNVDHGYVYRPDQFEWLPKARDAIRYCNDHGCLVFVITNQAGVARGYYDEQSVRDLHHWMNQDLAQIGAHIDAFEYCPHHPDGTVEEYRKMCDRRKPSPKMIFDLLMKWPVDSSRSLLIGDKASDIDAAVAAKIEGVLYTGQDIEKLVSSKF